MRVIDNRAILLKTDNPQQLVNIIPKSKDIGGRGALVHWGLEEAKVLRNLGFDDVPSPIEGRYNWTGLHKPMDHQITTAAFFTMNRKAYCFNQQGCVDSETEYLSPTGWVKISEYKGGEVAQYNPETRVANFVEPEEYVKIPCEKMVRVKTKYGLDQLLSPEHRVLLEDGKTSTRTEVASALEVLRRHDVYHTGYRIPKGGTKLGRKEISFTAMTIPTAFKGAGQRGIDLSPEQLRLQIAVIADGHFDSGSNRVVVRVKKERKKIRLRKLLNDANVAYNEKMPEYDSAKGFSIFTFQAPRREKDFSAWWVATKYQLDIVTDEVLFWDGCTTRGARFSSTNKESADFVQYAFAATGRTARLTEYSREGMSTEYVVQIRDTSRLYLRSNNTSVYEEASTDGYKYCFVVPSTFLVFRRNGCIFLSGNTGKTASVIWAADYLMSIGQIKRVLIVCPMSIMKSAWVDDLFTFAMHRTTTIAHNSDKRKRIQAINSGAEFVIINYDGLGIVEKELRAAKFDLIVADEATALKTATTKRWRTFNSLVTPDTWLWLLTGTPAAQSPLDAYGLARLVSPDRVPRFFSAFRDRVMNKVTQFKWAPKHNATEIVHEALQPAIRFTKEECMDLPELTYVTRDVQMSKQQEKYYEIIRKEMRAVTEGEEVTAVNAAARITKLLQIATGSVYTDSGEVLEFDNKDRLNTVLEVIEESSNKVIVFAPFKHSLARIHEFLESKGITSAIIGGGVPSQIRNQIFDDFQKTPDPRVLVIQPQAAAHGVTLTAADTIVWYAPTTSVELYLQGNARTHRAGQKNPCTVIRLQGSGVERHMNKMLQGNVDNHEKIVDLYKNILED